MSNRDALWESGHDETVEVNQRALIDKVLARYSGEFTVFRELLQNSDDAGARKVEIHFETDAYLRQKKQGNTSSNIGQLASVASQEIKSKEKLPDLKTAVVSQWTFKNDGIAFRDEDWSRLKKIAEGNPDEEKIGAFGVGFYSLFSVTEEPWVTSGGQWMGFYWKDKKDQLFARRGTLPAQSESIPDPWTVFQMELREPSPIPSAFDFTRFLVSSITFMAHLSEVRVFFDDKQLVRITKDGGVSKDIPMIRGLKPTSPRGIMNIKSVQSTPLDIQAEVIRWVYTVGTEKPASKTVFKPAAQSGGFFSSLFSSLGGSSTPQRTPTPQPLPPAPEVDLLEVSSSSVRLTIFSANVEVKLDRKLSIELQRSTKKNPPSRLKYELIYTGKPEYDASIKEEEKVKFANGSVFQGLRADLDGAGSARVFIGHSTGQTTGLGGHMATRFIPTVERESIDLVDRHVAVWNKELLYIGGYLSRTGYEREMANVKDKWDQAGSANGPEGKPDPEVQDWLRSQALHAMKFFSFYSSTPSPLVSAEMEAAFFSCGASHPFPIISSEGVKDVKAVRLPNPTLTQFLRRLPTLTEEVQQGAPRMIAALRSLRLIADVVFNDVLSELQSRPLSEAEAVACLKWWISAHKEGKVPPNERSRLLNAAVVLIAGPPERIVSLSAISKFLNAKKTGSIIPSDGPLPGGLLPTTISRNFDPDALLSVFPWTEFTILDWLKHIVDPAVRKNDPEHDITLSPHWAERMLNVLSRSWPNLSKAHQEEVVKLLKPIPCIPTSGGLKLPDQAYFASVNLFRDLPIVTFPSGGHIKREQERVLQVLGIRKHVELQMVFDRMIKTGDWTIVDLVNYLTSVQSTLSGEELQRLKHTSAFTKEEISRDSQNSVGKVSRFKASELYEPNETLRELKLPIIGWGTENRWKPTSNEAKFLFSLGLRRSPPIEDLLKRAAGEDIDIRQKALRYFVENYSKYSQQYDPQDFHSLAFIPAISKDVPCLSRPSEVFANPDWHKLGFPVVAPEWREHAISKFMISEHPASSQLVSLLEKTPPPDVSTASQWFQVLAGRIADFANTEQTKLSELPFVPIKVDGDAGKIGHLRPKECYFSGESSADFALKIFVFVDFGAVANSFLSFCGTKQEPSVEEIVQKLLSDPRQFFENAGGRDRYRNVLKNIALHRRLLTRSSIKRLERSNSLLASRRVRAKSEGKVAVDAEDEDWDYEYKLLRSGEIVIADDPNAYQMFGESVYSAPQDDLLEDFYVELGSRRLSSLIKEDYTTTKEILGSKIALEIRHLILERLPLFLHEHSQSRMKVKFEWLQDEKNFVVRTFGKLSVTRSLNYASVSASHTAEASAIARRDPRSGSIQLWLAGNTEVDMYEVSTSMCRCLFDSPKANDSLLFMTILSTDLRSLKRRGYHVDRILRRKKEEREEAEREARAALDSRQLMLAPDSPTKQPQNQPQKPGAQLPGPDTLPPPYPTDGPSQSATDTRHNQPFAPQTRLSSLYQNLKDKVSKRDGDQQPSQVGPSNRDWSKPPSHGGHVTPLSNIDANIQTAITACSEEKSNVLQTRQNMQMVKETQNEGYCDVSGHVGKLDAVGVIDGMRVFASPDLPGRDTLVQRKQAELSRFLNILNPICKVYQVSRNTLHIFADQEGPLIAFNRNGSLFVNFRYYEAWHDVDVRQGNTAQAFISWYFTLAHEIAHNLVQPHNSEHEFYFSSICEKYLPRLAELI